MTIPFGEEFPFTNPGWGRLYERLLATQEIVIRNDGMYQIEFSGHELSVSSEVLVKK